MIVLMPQLVGPTLLTLLATSNNATLQRCRAFVHTHSLGLCAKGDFYSGGGSGHVQGSNQSLVTTLQAPLV